MKIFEKILETGRLEKFWVKFQEFQVDVNILSRYNFVVVTKKPPMCQIMRLSLYCMNGLIEGRRIN